MDELAIKISDFLKEVKEYEYEALLEKFSKEFGMSKSAVYSWVELLLNQNSISDKRYDNDSRQFFHFNHEYDPIECEQDMCQKKGVDRQFYCMNCDKNLCSICVNEHKEQLSISGLKCDVDILDGKRDLFTVGVIKTIRSRK